MFKVLCTDTLLVKSPSSTSVAIYPGSSYVSPICSIILSSPLRVSVSSDEISDLVSLVNVDDRNYNYNSKYY